jgi:adenine deaminase
MKLLFLIILPLVILSGCATTKNNFQPKTIAIKNVSVIDVITGSVLSNQTIVIQKNEIVAMGNSAEIRNRNNYRRHIRFTVCSNFN